MSCTEMCETKTLSKTMEARHLLIYHGVQGYIAPLLSCMNNALRNPARATENCMKYNWHMISTATEVCTDYDLSQ